MEDTVTAQEAFRRGVHFLGLNAPESRIVVRNTTPGLEDGPCELLYRTLEMPVDDLNKEPSYCLGVASRYLGYLLDSKGASTEFALQVYGELLEAIEPALGLYAKAAEGHFLVSILVRAFKGCTKGMFAGRDIEVQTANYVEYALQMQPELDDTNPLGVPLDYVDPALKDIARLSEQFPKCFISSDVYDQCEISDWPYIQFNVDALPKGVICIGVEGETWPRAVNDPTKEVQTDWLVIDAREANWHMCERVKVRGVGVPAGMAYAQGSVWNTRTGSSRSIESTAVFDPKNGTHLPIKMNRKQAERLERVAISFLVLMTSKSTKLTSLENGNCRLELPEGWTVNRVIAEALRDAGQ